MGIDGYFDDLKKAALLAASYQLLATSDFPRAMRADLNACGTLCGSNLICSIACCLSLIEVACRSLIGECSLAVARSRQPAAVLLPVAAGTGKLGKLIAGSW